MKDILKSKLEIRSALNICVHDSFKRQILESKGSPSLKHWGIQKWQAARIYWSVFMGEIECPFHFQGLILDTNFSSVKYHNKRTIQWSWYKFLKSPNRCCIWWCIWKLMIWKVLVNCVKCINYIRSLQSLCYFCNLRSPLISIVFLCVLCISIYCI